MQMTTCTDCFQDFVKGSVISQRGGVNHDLSDKYNVVYTRKVLRDKPTNTRLFGMFAE